jgi:hypothetical protein
MSSVCKAAMAAHDRALCHRAKIVIAGQALATRKAAVGEPAEPDSLAALEPFGFIAESDHRTDYFMTGYEWVRRPAPFVVEHRKIGVAKAAVRDLDLDFLGAEFTWIEAKRLRRPLG